MRLRLSDAGDAGSIPGQGTKIPSDPWSKGKKKSVSRYSTASGRLRNKRKEGIKDEGGTGHREEMK